MKGKVILQSPVASVSDQAPQYNSDKPTYPQNIILYGPPGCGKTYVCQRLAQDIVEGEKTQKLLGKLQNKDIDYPPKDDMPSSPDKNSENIRWVSFHQNYAYEDFVEGFRPAEKKQENGQVESTQQPAGINIKLQDGIFKQICAAAKDDSEQPYVLIIDEINRGNISKIFGELITLLEENKRADAAEEKTVELPYSNEPFSVPRNLFVIGTMNSTDKSIALIDAALRRRFTFVRMDPKPELVKDAQAKELMKALNEKIEATLGKDSCIGHSYFMKVADDSAEGSYDMKYLVNFRLRPLIEEYCYANDNLKKDLEDILDSYKPEKNE